MTYKYLAGFDGYAHVDANSGLSAGTFVSLAATLSPLLSSVPTGSITPGAAGQIFVTNSSPASVWTGLISYETTHGRFTAGGGDGYMEAVIGPMSGSETNFGALYLVPHNTSLTTSNAVVYSDGANQIAFNSPGTSPTYFWQAQASTFTTLTTSALTLTTVPTVQWGTTVSPSVTQITPASDVATHNITLTPQAPFSGAATNLLAGDVIVNTSSSVGSGNKFGGFQVQYNGTVQARIGSYNNGGYSAIWFQDGGSPTSSNFSFLANNSGYTAINEAHGGTIHLAISNNDAVLLSSSTLTLNTVSLVQFVSTIASPTINQAAKTSDVATQNLTFTSQAPFSGAVTNVNSGNFIFNVPASVSGSPYGQGNIIQYGGTNLIRLATYAGTAGGAIWFLDGGSPATTNWALFGNTTNTQMNSPTAGGELYFSVNGVPYLTVGSPISFGSPNPGVSIGLVYTSPDYVFDLSHTATLHFTTSTTSAAIKYDPQTTDISTKNLTITAQGPWSGALTNQATGNVLINFPTPTVTSNDGYYGQLQIQNAGVTIASVESHHGKITAGGGDGYTQAVIGPDTSNPTLWPELWLLLNGVSPTNGNWTLRGDGTNLTVQPIGSGTPGGAIQFSNPTVTYASLNATALTMTTPTIQFVAAATSPTINQAAPGATSAGQNMTIAPQAGGATSGQPGALLLNIAAPNGGSTEGSVAITRATTPFARFGPYLGAPTSFGAIYFMDAGSPSTTNWAFLGSAGDTYLNAPVSNMYFKIANNTIAMGATSQHVDFGGATSASVTPALTIDFSGGTTAPVVKTGNTTSTTTLKVGITAMTADVAQGNLTIQGAYAFSSATGTHRTPGNVVFDIGAPTNSGTTEAAFQFTRNGSTIGQLGISNSSQYSLWLGASAFTVSNAVLYADGASFTYVNAPTNVGVVIGDSFFAMYASSTNVFFGGTSTTSPLDIDWSTATTPFIRSGTSATSLTIGTNKAGASTILQGDAGITTLTLSGSQNGIATFAGAIDGYVRSTAATFTVDSGSNDYYIWATATQTITLPAPTKGRTLWLVVDATGGGATAITINLNRNGGTGNINGVAANYPAFTVPANSVEKYLIMSPDGTNWILT